MMKLLTKNTDYAVRALVYLARHEDRFIPSREISESEKIPLSFLRRLLQTLAREGLLTTKEGGRGGVKLKVPPESIRLTRLIGILQGKIQLADCIFRKRLCHNRAHCPLRKRIKGIEQRVISELEDITVKSLLDDLTPERGDISSRTS